MDGNYFSLQKTALAGTFSIGTAGKDCLETITKEQFSGDYSLLRLKKIKTFLRNECLYYLIKCFLKIRIASQQLASR